MGGGEGDFNFLFQQLKGSASCRFCSFQECQNTQADSELFCFLEYELEIVGIFTEYPPPKFNIAPEK